MPIGIVIPVDESEPIFRKQFGAFTDYQETIGGYFQPIDIQSPEATIYVDEEGKLKHLDVNRRATILAWLHNPAFRGRDVLCGTVVIIGPPDSEGDTTDVPQSLDDLLFETIEYKYEVQTADSAIAWNGNQMRYTYWLDAYNDALALADRWMAVEAIRVVPA
jgi:hypothetical protein